MNEAVDLASDSKRAVAFLANYRIQAHAGWGMDLRLGVLAIEYEILLRNLSKDCDCTATVEMRSARSLPASRAQTLRFDDLVFTRSL